MGGFRVSKIQRGRSYGAGWDAKRKADKVALGRVCSRCGRAGTPANQVQRHHLIPRSRGGSDARINLKLLCEACHSRHHRHL